MALDLENVEIGKSEVYWKNVDRYELTFGDRKLVLHKEEDSNGGDTHYIEGYNLFTKEEIAEKLNLANVVPALVETTSPTGTFESAFSLLEEALKEKEQQ